MIKIGISACFMYPDLKRKIFGPKTLLYMGHDMSHFLGLKGVMPILIPDLPDDEIFEQFLGEMDGFLFQGGLDITPEIYGETPLNYKFEGDPQRDLYELKIMDYAFKNEKPILGICRGMQLLNVYLKGTLYQDLDIQFKGAHEHMNDELYDNHIHGIEFSQGSLFSKLHEKCQNKFVNSVHHQAVKDLGEGLIVEAVCSEDKTIEAISYSKDGKNSYKKGLFSGIQWHPEFFHTMDMKNCIDAHPILNNFLENCSKIKKKKKD